MGRKKLSEHTLEDAARLRADLSEKMRAAWRNRESNGYGTRVDGSLQEDVQRAISESVRRKWQEGAYTNRVNGMTGKSGSQHPNWSWGETEYSEIAMSIDGSKCSLCGEDSLKLNVHHIDENTKNYLLSNLIVLCVPCHAWRYHYHQFRQPFVEISKSFPFEYSHILPWHPGKCSQLHGHSGVLTVKVFARLDPNGVVEDFYDISQVVKMSVINPLDHQFLNSFLENPTSEEFLIFAWRCLESAGLKGLSELTFSETASSSSTLTKSSMIEAFGWDKIDNRWEFIRKGAI